MQINGMEDTLIAIWNIRNISSIKLTSFTFNKSDSNKLVLVPILTVIYDGGKTITLSSREKYFNTFVKKVTEVYNDEKNNIVEDSLTDPFKFRTHINIDENTKRILESGKLIEVNDIYKFYENKYSYDSSLLFDSDKFKLLLPVIKYHIEHLFSKTDRTVSINNNYQGYKNNFILYGNVDGLEKLININVLEENENDYTFLISGIFPNSNPIEMKLRYKKDRIEVILENKAYELYAEYKYLANSEKVKQIISINKSDTIVLYENSNLDECENIISNITNLDNNSNFRWFRLPWNAMYGINNSIEDISEYEKMISTYSMYVLVNEDSFYKRENYAKTYKKGNTSVIKSDEIVLDDICKNTTCICIYPKENIYVIETSFLDTKYPDGFYLEKLKNKYFYHAMRCEDGISGILLENGISIDKSIALGKADLNKNVILRLSKGDK